MPQASDKLVSIISGYFGKYKDNVSFDNECIKFLESHGYILTKQWFWIKPVSSHNISEDEWNCIRYLIDEWDFGGIAE